LLATELALRESPRGGGDARVDVGGAGEPVGLLDALGEEGTRALEPPAADMSGRLLAPELMQELRRPHWDGGRHWTALDAADHALRVSHSVHWPRWWSPSQ